ncbi:unnamed protein product [Protopolystoma xenopodis]|uniref:Uncharacterized protein n=1 Tax=Protopolystoma xenopodis TaxID=117903 RepID=A0A3S5AY97_9PLAT|nr:unnamed protein product [Protopolystoma xenopodis]
MTFQTEEAEPEKERRRGCDQTTFSNGRASLLDPPKDTKSCRQKYPWQARRHASAKVTIYRMIVPISLTHTLTHSHKHSDRKTHEQEIPPFSGCS